MDELTYLGNADSSAIEELYNRFKSDPLSVENGWRHFFEGFEFSGRFGGGSSDMMAPEEFKVIDLINGYRKRGHLFTRTNPVRTRRKYSPTLDLENFGLSAADLDRSFEAGREIGIGKATLRQIISRMEQTYCHSIGVEYAYIRRTEIESWLRTTMEANCNVPAFDLAKRQVILQRLSEAVFFERFLHRKFTGQKRFSLEGAEALIPALDAVIEKGAGMGIDEFVIGMPHRGRLSVLSNILGKSYKDIFSEFENKAYEDETLLGDVKYHLGYSSERVTRAGKKINLSLAPNPSHLEAVSPVVEGIVRSRIDSTYAGDSSRILPILIHGDASIAGQGIVYEVIQMSELEGYKTGGTIHLVVNNQIGFTTNYLDARSSIYCTDVAKTIQAPIFHVNSDDVEAVVYTIELAMEYRARFKKDVFIDLLGYRKYGHNEGDEPRFTQPVLYKAIESHPNPRDIYVEKLIAEGILGQQEADAIEQSYNAMLESDLTASKETDKAHVTPFMQNAWTHIHHAVPGDFEKPVNTAVKLEGLLSIGHQLTRLPADKAFYKKIVKLMDERAHMFEAPGKLDWAMGELLAYGTLISEGVPVRLSGQDSERGTFSHRHAVLTVEDSEEKYTPLQHVSPGQKPFQVYNSLLSEYGVLGFEYGYALASPDALTLWEAQFGDFFNGAQIIIDQYLSSAEEKWRVMNPLVLLLPHGYEGQGPEHSSGRIERFLMQCADNNMQVANCTTPANFFHLLRRQMLRNFRKPLIVFTPKSLLRHPRCVSELSEFTVGGFRELIDDATVDPEAVSRVVFCSGKLYYDLVEHREKTGAFNTALVRLEQLYPLPLKQMRQVIDRYPHAKRYVWAQEEPANMGAWSFILRNFKEVELLMVARPESGSPATGSPRLHALRQQKIIDKSFGECTCENANITCRMTCAPTEWNILNETEARLK
jgi:2-oxoglutarate dehydrogenase E1 component